MKVACERPSGNTGQGRIWIGSGDSLESKPRAFARELQVGGEGELLIWVAVLAVNKPLGSLIAQNGLFDLPVLQIGVGQVVDVSPVATVREPNGLLAVADCGTWLA